MPSGYGVLRGLRHSVRQLRSDIPSNVAKENTTRLSSIGDLFRSTSGDVQGINAWRYQRQVSGGVQEFMEAVSFQHYLETQTLVTYEDAKQKIPGSVDLTEDDYLLGIFDLVGELMRFAITAMATNGSLPGSTPESGEPGAGVSDSNILTDLRSLRTYLEALDTTSSTSSGSALGRDVEKKMGVMKTCVEKVENAAYGMIIRGRERPKGWVPDLAEDARRGAEPVESY